MNHNNLYQNTFGDFWFSANSYRVMKPGNSVNPYRVMKSGKNGDRRHKDNKGVNEYRRKTDTKMPPEVLTARIKEAKNRIDALYKMQVELQAKISAPKSLRRRVLDWLLD